MFCDETNLYYFQNREKNVTGFKGIKWSYVNATERKNLFSIIF
jgi:hypothetical protein